MWSMIASRCVDGVGDSLEHLAVDPRGTQSYAKIPVFVCRQDACTLFTRALTHTHTIRWYIYIYMCVLCESHTRTSSRSCYQRMMIILCCVGLGLGGSAGSDQLFFIDVFVTVSESRCWYLVGLSKANNLWKFLRGNSRRRWAPCGEPLLGAAAGRTTTAPPLLEIVWGFARSRNYYVYLAGEICMGLVEWWNCWIE